MSILKKLPFSSTAIAALTAALLYLPLQTNAQSQREELETMEAFLSIMGSYYSIIESSYAIASDSEKSAIIKMHKIQEVYEELGQKAKAANLFRQVLKDSDNSTIRNAAYMLLADNLKDTGRAADALELLKTGLDENIAEARE